MNETTRAREGEELHSLMVGGERKGREGTGMERNGREGEGREGEAGEGRERN